MLVCIFLMRAYVQYIRTHMNTFKAKRSMLFRILKWLGNHCDNNNNDDNGNKTSFSSLYMYVYIFYILAPNIPHTCGSYYLNTSKYGYFM